MPFGLVLSGASNGVQPSAGSTKWASSPSSLPFASTAAPPIAFLFATVSCAVCPFPFIRYSETTLSLWSWSISEKLSVDSHACPSVPVPSLGTLSLPVAIWTFASA